MIKLRSYTASLVLALFGFVCFSKAQTAPPNGLIGWWTGDSNTVDLVNGNDATLVSGATYGSGEVSNAFSFNGTSSYAEVPDNGLWAFGTNAFTIELWANFAASTGQRAFVGSDTGGGTVNKWIFWLNNGVLQFHINGSPGGADFVGTTPFSPNLSQWYHLAVARNGTSYVFYINGAPVSTNTDSRAVPDANAPLTFGAAEGSLFFAGQLDEISIYNRALTAGDISNIFNAGAAGKDKGANLHPLQILTAPTNVTVWEPDPVTLTASATGTAPLTYQWQFNGTNIADATNASYSIAATSPANSGVYTILVGDATSAQTNASATVTVIPFDGTIYWTNAAGGNWSVANNWVPNRIPGATNTAVITNNGTYTVTVNSTTVVSNLVVGAAGATGTVTLSVPNTLRIGNSAVFETNSVFTLSGSLKTFNTIIEIRGLMNWSSADLSGSGRTIVAAAGKISFNGYNSTKLISTNILENYGTLSYSADGGFGPGLLPTFANGAQLTNYASGLIQIGAGNSYDYSGTQTLRSYLVNYGTISCGGSASVPGEIAIDLINYGTISGGFCYIHRGTNYGTLSFANTLADLSFFGDEANGEYFSFEPGTTLVGARPNIDVAGLARWNAPATPHNGQLRVGPASGGASSAGAQFLVTTAYTNTYQVAVQRGELTIPANATADFRLLSDAIANNWTYLINNMGTIDADNITHAGRTFSNAGSTLVRSNITLSGGAFNGSGHLTLTNTATGTFSGGSIDAQTIDNFGNISLTAGTPLTGNSYLENKTNAQLTFVAGGLQTGPALVVNYGAIAGYGSIAVTTTNFGTVLADDSLSRALTLSNYRQVSGQTEVRRATMAGNLQIFGGTLFGTNTITGNIYNAATVSPGNPFGRLTLTGNYTNSAQGVETMPMAGTNVNAYPTLRVSGTASLAGTLRVTFTNGYFPVTGNTFTAMTYTARSGVFDQIQTPNYDFQALYTPTNLLLMASNALPSIALTISGGSTQYVCQPFTIAVAGSDTDGSVTNASILFMDSPLATTGATTASASLEFDYPSTQTIVGIVQDNRGGASYSTQIVSFVTLPLHTLELGGFRTNGFKICMLGEAGSNYVMLATTNLRVPRANWTNLGTLEETNGIFRFFDTNTTGMPLRFYEAKQVP